MRNIKYIVLVIYASVLLASCARPEGDFPGSEYMPDMAHGIAYEANTYSYYYLNTWDSASVITVREASYPMLPVKGTVARGYAGLFFAQQTNKTDQMRALLNGETDVNAIAVSKNPAVPYYYPDTPEGREQAGAELIENPFPITAEGLAKGEQLYGIFCAICHGPGANGMGYLVSEDNPNQAYPAAPANLLLDQYVNYSNGRYYHAIMYGLNLMGAYKAKLNYEERWQVIHYIRHLQAQDKGLQYDQNANTLNPAYGTPVSELEQIAGSKLYESPEQEPESAEPQEEFEGGGEGDQQSDQETESHEGGGH